MKLLPYQLISAKNNNYIPLKIENLEKLYKKCYLPALLIRYISCFKLLIKAILDQNYHADWIKGQNT